MSPRIEQNRKEKAMTYVDQRTATHNYFYAENKSFQNRNSFSYSAGVAYSYNTAVCRICTSNKGEKTALFSWDTFSITTARTLCYLRQACPFPMIYVPARRYGNLNNATILSDFEKRLESIKEKGFVKIDNRRCFETYYCDLKQLLDVAEFKSEYNKIKVLLKKYKKSFDLIRNDAGIKALKAKERAKRKKEKQAFEKLIRNKSISELAFLAYGESSLEREKAYELRKTINPRGEMAFVWYDESDDCFETSKGIRIEGKEGRLFLEAFKNKKLRVGAKISDYTVLKMTKTTIRIGCHLIPIANLTSLAKDSL